MTPNDPLFPLQWYLNNTGQAGGTPGIDINVEKVWDDFNGAGVTVGVYDDGVETTGPNAQPDLVGNYDPALQPFVNGAQIDGQPLGNQPGQAAHGTAVAGIIAASTNNGLGVAGIAFGAKFGTVRVLGSRDFPISDPAFSDLLATTKDFDVTNNSWGYVRSFIVSSAADLAAWGMAADEGRDGLGTIVVKSAGNDRTNGFAGPPFRDANDLDLNVDRHAIVVGALLNTGFVADYSSPGTNLLVSAPAGPTITGLDQDITTDRVGSLGYNPALVNVPAGQPDYTAFNGTSAAAPVVSGVVALMLQADPNLGWRDVQTILAYSARHVGSDIGVAPPPFNPPQNNELNTWGFNNADNWNGGGLHFSRDYGFGMVDALAAVRLAETWDVGTPVSQTSGNEQQSGTIAGSITGGTAQIGPGQTTTVSFHITDPIRVEDVAVNLNLEFANDVSELAMTLNSPDRTASKLWVGGGDTSTLPASWTFASRQFLGETASGMWTLSITNNGTNPLVFEPTLLGATLTAYGGEDTGHNNFVYTDEFATYGTLPGRDTLTDTTGIGTFDAAAVTTNATIDLVPGTTSMIAGHPVTITAGSTIENAIGGDGNDVLIGNSADNILIGGRGNDLFDGDTGNNRIDGGPGDNTAAFTQNGIAQNAANYQLLDFNKLIVATGPQSHDHLFNIEHLNFADGTINPQDGNPLIDTPFYLSRYPDVFHAGIGAVTHYDDFGFKEGRDPNFFFSTSGYLSANKDVAAAGVNPLDHFDQFGWKEGRDPSIRFDTRLYLLQNPDVKAAGIDPLTHFLEFGASEGRAAPATVGPKILAGFDAEYYLLANPDVGKAGVDPLLHFETFGWKEGRNPSSYFNTKDYLAANPDVAAAGVNPLQHYDMFGWKEGRNVPIEENGTTEILFGTNAYLAANPDVAAAHIDPLQHFLQFGIFEGRSSFGVSPNLVFA